MDILKFDLNAECKATVRLAEVTDKLTFDMELFSMILIKEI